MKNKITTFFMFEGKAEEAINFYISLFEDSKIETISRYGTGEEGPKGSIRQAVFTLNGQQYMTIDSPIEHAFTFTPSVSLFVNCDTEEELDNLFGELSENGEILMPLDNLRIQ